LPLTVIETFIFNPHIWFGFNAELLPL